jgi:hypothetical protein
VERAGRQRQEEKRPVKMTRDDRKKDQELEEQFLNKHAAKVPRTMLRYTIEKFDVKKRKFYLTKI